MDALWHVPNSWHCLSAMQAQQWGLMSMEGARRVVTSAVKDAKALLHDARLRPNWWPPERKAEWCARPTYTMQHAQGGGGQDARRRWTKPPPSFIPGAGGGSKSIWSAKR
jgi:hypothetical protein